MSIYEFIACIKTSSGVEPIVLDIREHDERAEEQFRRCWDKMHQALRNYHECVGTDAKCPSWAQWNTLSRMHQKASVGDRLKFAAWDGDSLAGFLHLRPNVSLDGRDKTLYVESMASAPGSRQTEIWGSTEMSHVGAALLAFAINVASEKSLGSGISLHADTDDIAGYYRNLRIDGKPLFAPDELGVPGPAPLGDKMKVRAFFATLQDGANALLERYRIG